MGTKWKGSSGVPNTAKAGQTSRGPRPDSSTRKTITGSDEHSDANHINVKTDNTMDKGIINLSTDMPGRRAGRDLARAREPDHGGLARMFGSHDFSYLKMKPDHKDRLLWIDPDKGRIIMESFHPLAQQAQDFLTTVAEPLSRPMHIHEFALTTHSLYAAVSLGLSPEDIISTLDRFLKLPLPEPVRNFIHSCTQNHGKVKLVLKSTKYFIESPDRGVLQELLRDEVIRSFWPRGFDVVTGCGLQNAAELNQTSNTLQQDETRNLEMKLPDNKLIQAILNEEGEDVDEHADVMPSFEVPDIAVEALRKRCLELQYPVLEEYDFRTDHTNPDLEIDLRSGTTIRHYQEKALSKMFGNGRAKSGIIVLPCGAGKTLVGITAACTVKKGAVVLCTSSTSVTQWRNEFLKWSNVSLTDITAFTADSKDTIFTGSTGLIITTYAMVTQTRERSRKAKEMMDFLTNREWGLMVLDEVHVVPADMFRQVTRIKTHSKLGLTATLLREDDKVSDLNFLVGPKLYEANWMELSEQGHIAKVQCAEVWCPMSTEFFEQYMEAGSRDKAVLCAMNPYKFQACQYLIQYHESRGDKIIVFSDDIYALKAYALKLEKALIFGGTSQLEREDILLNFQHNPEVNTLFLSKIGDTSLDLPEATCLIQISSHYGSRRQEAQRLGRILRAKRRNDEGFNAFFYSLVSKDTEEMYYSSKRQAFLTDQGYAFKVITELPGLDQCPALAYSTAEERRDLLQTILAEREQSEEKEEVEQERRRNLFRKRKREPHNAFFKQLERERARRNGG